MSLVELLGENLRKPDGEVVPTTSAVAGKEVIGLYFSAHWCPPCRGFTPVLCEKYSQLISDKQFELVFVSSDKDEVQFNEYHGEMNFLALPYAEREKKAKLSKKFKVSGIPTLVLLDASGNLITKDGRSAVMEPEKFPWTPPTMAEALGKEFIKGDGEKVTLDSIMSSGATIAVYFSAHWCPPCKRFTPELAKVYNKLRQAGTAFEVIFASSDRETTQFKEYFAEMPWLAIPYEERDRKEGLSGKFEVQGIPHLVILDSHLNVINSDAVGDVSSDPPGKNFPWMPKDVMEIEEKPELLNEVPALVVLMEEAADSWDDIEEMMCHVAKEKFSRLSPGEDRDFAFFMAKEVGGITQQIRALTRLGKPGKVPEMMLMDFSDEGSFYKFEGENITEQGMRQFLADYEGKQLTKLSVKQ